VVLRRIRRRGEVRAREVLELRLLRRRGRAIPDGDPSVSVAARAEAALGGRELAAWVDGPPAEPPVPVAHSWPALRRLAGLIPRRRVVVAVSGVDGSGKSSLVRSLASSLSNASVPVSVVWTRPGMGGGLATIGRWAKRALRQDQAPGMERMARGDAPDAMASRRGVIGWAWAWLVVVSHAAATRRRHAAAGGVVLYDRHLLDARATLDFFYGGAATGAHHAALSFLMPKADLTVYLDVPPSVAVARKPGDAFGDRAVRGQLVAYEGELAAARDRRWVVVMDGARPSADIAFEVLRSLTGAGDD
jgi:thymidylate kinase